MTIYRLTDAQRRTYRRYAGLALPRHTSYPIAPTWTTEYGPGGLRDELRRSAAESRPLSLYVHVPFCERLCYYCACTKEIVPTAKRKQNDPSDVLLAGLEVEAGRFGALVGAEVRQVHLGGGSPTFLPPEGLRRLWAILADRFAIAPDAEIAAEIDPRITTREHLETLRGSASTASAWAFRTSTGGCRKPSTASSPSSWSSALSAGAANSASPRSTLI